MTAEQLSLDDLADRVQGHKEPLVLNAIRDYEAAHPNAAWTLYDCLHYCGLDDLLGVKQAGAITSSLAKRHIIRAVGYCKSSRPESAGSAVREWRLSA